MKIDVGFYVRTKYQIRRITKIENDFVYLDRMIKDSLETTYDRVYINDIDKYFIKASNKLRNIIKQGDYINSYKVLDIVDDEKGCVLFIDGKRGYIKLNEIKEIMTKEFYEKERYIIGE